MKREHVAAIPIALMAATTLAGSVLGLLAFAEIGKAGTIEFEGAPIPVGAAAFVAALDGLAISLTILAHRKGSTDWAAFWGVVAATVVSTVLQVAAVWHEGPAAIIVHGLPAPCTGVAAFFLLRSLGHEGALPPPPSTTGGLKDETPTSERTDAAMDASPATGVPLTSGTERRPTSSAPVTQGSGGRKGRGRSGGSAPLPTEERARLAAVWLAEKEMALSARNVEAAVRATSGSCSREVRTAVYSILSEPGALDVWAGASERDQGHATETTIGDDHVS